MKLHTVTRTMERDGQLTERHRRSHGATYAAIATEDGHRLEAIAYPPKAEGQPISCQLKLVGPEDGNHATLRVDLSLPEGDPRTARANEALQSARRLTGVLPRGSAARRKADRVTRYLEHLLASLEKDA